MTNLVGEYGLDQVKAFANSSSTIGASGAIYGLLATFGMLYPNRTVMLLIPPIPMKAKYFVLVFGVLGIFLDFTSSYSSSVPLKGSVAHLAHIGGALVAALLVIWWRKQGERF